MRKFFIPAAFMSSLFISAGGIGQRAAARGENGVWHTRGDMNCVEFLKRDKDETAARARTSNPGTGYFTAEYTIAVYYIVGLVTGANWGLSDVSDVFPRFENEVIIELVKRQCDQNPTGSVVTAVMETILSNKSNWQWKDQRLAPNHNPTIQSR